jgi:hypothetical protein
MITSRIESQRVTVRPAEPADNAARCDVFARVVMEGDLVLSVRRDPDFDALYRLQTDRWLSVVIELDGVVEGTGTILVRDGYIDGVRRSVGYLGDLRFSPRIEGRMLLERHFGHLLQDVRERYGCELFLTAVIAANARAVRALTRETERSRRAGRPRYIPVGEFDIRSLHLLMPKREERSPYRVRRASTRDIPALVRLLDDDARARPFGHVFVDGELERRLREWPGLSIESFLCAESKDGRLLGALALWDAAPVKRMVPLAYRSRMRSVRFAYNAVATLLGMPRMPKPGVALRYVYATHVVAPSTDPGVLRALLIQAHRSARDAGFQFMSICAPHDALRESAFRGFQATNIPARLFAVALRDVDVPASVTGGTWPGFEMALV